MRLILLTCLVAGAGCAAAPSRPITELTAEEWKEDLRFVVDRLTREHPALFEYHDIEPDRFGREAEDLERSLAAASAAETVLRMDRLVAMVGDGHTSLDAVQTRARLPRYPFMLAYFGEELRVYSTPDESRQALGAEVLAIDGTPTHEALERVSALISRDNDQELRWLGPRYLVSPDALAFVGVAESAERATYRLQRGDSVFDFEVTPWPLERFTSAPVVTAAEAAGAPTPLYLSRPTESYWLEHLRPHRALYLKWNRVDDAPEGPSLGRFYRTLFEIVDREGVERLVVDLRHSNGGNYLKARRFFDQLATRPGLELYVLTGPQTFSAATYVAARLRFELGATVVGEVSRGNPNFTYNAERVSLPHSGLHLQYTDRIQDPAPFPELGDRRYLPVDVPVERSFADYVAGRDPILERALSGRRPQ